MRNYQSMEDIDKHLKILRLQADIHKQRAEIDLKYIKHTLKPSNLFAEFVAMLSQKYLYKKIVQIIVNKFRA
ncbi:DUF6327 family protein [Mesohalobacter halotolerans]|uniref:Uncharacterized protein n=1 Tax=Mesohalobacter halotolerans TaxID=1883405 RepID=A0A4U5TVN8_9FLAO|nr:DUF6327 family protein [Mesohalobacter halotolerans]MBS3738983.1 hypothetical protein [Psychroflexus sp.]NBC57382.1 hypothetical protein [Bacteroidota bacterium]TKS57674.1 hypothetical protein FCN74_04460 [Mesohalobacter halotolerans]